LYFFFSTFSGQLYFKEDEEYEDICMAASGFIFLAIPMPY
jgi:hypothetical protein